MRNAERLSCRVGAFAACMRELLRAFRRLVRERVPAGSPLLAYALALQLLFEESEEFGRTPGLGLLLGQVEVSIYICRAARWLEPG